MVEEFLEKLPEIDTRYEVSTKRFALFSCSPHIEKSGSQAGAQLLFRASNSSAATCSTSCRPAACLLFVLLFKLHFPTSICIMLTLPQRVEPSQAMPSQARRSVYVGRIFNQFADAAFCCLLFRLPLLHLPSWLPFVVCFWAFVWPHLQLQIAHNARFKWIFSTSLQWKDSSAALGWDGTAA